MVKFSGLPDPLEPRRLRERALPFVLLYAAALIIRVAHVWVTAWPAAVPAPEAAAYDEVAWSLATGAGFSVSDGLARAPTADIAPLVPWLASLAYRVFGHAYFAALLFQCVIGALVPLLVARLGAPLFGASIGLIAGVVLTIDPLLVAGSEHLRPESALTAAMLWAMIVSVEWVRGPSGRKAFWVGAAWGVAALAHPAALPLPLVTIAWAWEPLGLMLAPRVRGRQILYVIVGLAVAVLPWMIRNAMAVGAFTLVESGAPVEAGRGDASLLPWAIAVAAFATWGAAIVLRGARRWYEAFPLWVIAAVAVMGVVVAEAPRAWVVVEPGLVLLAVVAGMEAWRRVRGGVRGR
jgi:4-amino-4-deoxy-L-arabinose transferase-like glycosyltransferase